MSASSAVGDLQDQLQALWTAAFDPKLLDPTSEEFPIWRRLASFRPSAEAQANFLARGAGNAFFFHKLESAAGDTVNLDFLKLRIDQLPGGADGPGLLNTIRRRFDGWFRLPWYQFAYEIGFGPSSDADGDAWASMDPNDAQGAVMQFEIGLNGTGGLLVDRAGVLCSDITPTSWIFTTVSTDKAWGHPVSGNRTWWMEQKGGIWYFCCAGVDRATKLLDPLWPQQSASGTQRDSHGAH